MSMKWELNHQTVFMGYLIGIFDQMWIEWWNCVSWFCDWVAQKWINSIILWSGAINLMSSLTESIMTQLSNVSFWGTGALIEYAGMVDTVI